MIIGIYDGFYGPGTGTFLIIAFTTLIIFLMNGQVLFTLGIVAAICNMTGGYIGAGLALKNGAKIAKPSIIFVLILLALKVFGVY